MAAVKDADALPARSQAVHVRLLPGANSTTFVWKLGVATKNQSRDKGWFEVQYEKT